MFEPVRLHGITLVGAQAKVRTGFAGADEREARRLVLGVVTAGIRVVDLARKHSNGAGDIPALLA